MLRREEDSKINSLKRAKSLRLLFVVPVCLYAITLLPLVTSFIDSV